MDAEVFVANWVQQKQELVELFCGSGSQTAVQQLIADMNLNPTQSAQLKRVIDAALTDAMYGLLLGLDGAASIGADQRPYQIFAEESGELVATPGELESTAYEGFHGQ